MASFQMAGSIVLLLFGLKMVLGKVAEEAAAFRPTPRRCSAPLSLAIPGIAGAGSILTVVLLTDNNVRSVAEQAHHRHPRPLPGSAVRLRRRPIFRLLAGPAPRS